MCIALGFAVAGCETQPVEETPTVDVEVSGEAVEVVLPDEVVEAITDAVDTEEVVVDEEMMDEEAAE